MKKILILLFLLLTIAPVLRAESLPAAPQKFVHPGCYYRSSDIEFMRKKIAAKAEPWNSAFEKFKPTARDLGWKPHAVAEWDATKDLYMSGDPTTAHKLALAWALTGNQACADKAIEILNGWSSTLKSVAKHEMPQEKLGSGINVHHLVNAAELLRHATSPDGKKSNWADADVQRFKQMLLLFDGTMKDFQPGYNGNWDAIMMESMICAAVFLDDRAMFERVVKHYVEGVKPNGGLANYVYPSGQCQESSRDMGHVQWGLGGLVATCEVAWKQGVDLYSAHDNRLMLGLEYTAKYNLGNEVPFQGTAAKPKIAPRGAFAPIWETGYQHYVYRKGLAMPFTKQVIFGDKILVGKTTGAYRPEMNYNAGISWGTLTMFKGAEDPQAKKP